MAEQAVSSENDRRPDPPDEGSADAGRLNGASTPRLLAVLVSLVLITEIAAFQQGMVAVVVPRIGASFPAAGPDVSWVITIVGVVGGATTGLIGKFADLWGKKRLLLTCSLLFLAGSLICALTTFWPLFLLGRGMSAVSAGMIAVSYGLVRDLMPRKWIPLCVGVVGTGFGLAGVAGPLICGALTDHFGWRSVFWFLIIYVVGVTVIALAAVPESPLRARQRFDLVGAALLGVGVGAVLIYVSKGSEWGWGSPGCVAYLLGGVVALLAFVRWEGRTAEPMMELSLLRSPDVSLVLAAAFVVTGLLSMNGLSVAYMFQTPPADHLRQQVLAGIAAQSHTSVAQVAPFVHFQGGLGYAAGFSTLQMVVHITMWTSLVAMIFGPLGGHIARRFGSRLPLLVGTCSLLAACALWVPWHTTWQEQLAIGVLFGIGTGLYFAASPNLIIDAVPAERQGVSAGMLAVFGSIGTATASALFGAIQGAHPLRLVISRPGGTSIVSDIPSVYADAGYTQIYLLIGVVPAALAVLCTLALRSGRTPALGGAAPEPAT